MHLEPGTGTVAQVAHVLPRLYPDEARQCSPYGGAWSCAGQPHGRGETGAPVRSGRFCLADTGGVRGGVDRLRRFLRYRNAAKAITQNTAKTITIARRPVALASKLSPIRMSNFSLSSRIMHPLRSAARFQTAGSGFRRCDTGWPSDCGSCPGRPVRCRWT